MVAQGLDLALGEGRPRGEHGGPRQPGLLGDRVVRNPLGSQQDRLAPARHALRGGPCPEQGFQVLPLASVDGQRGRFGEHAP